jgi:hypothetical protein
MKGNPFLGRGVVPGEVMATARLDRDEVTGGRLPQMCMKCGAAATVERKKSFSWCPPWVGVLILAGLLPYVIVASILTKRMTVHAPFCAEHQNHWSWRNWFIWGGFACLALLGFGAFVLMVSADTRGGRNSSQADLGGIFCIGTIGIGLVWLIAAAIIQNTGIRPSEITDDGISLINVARDFVDAVDEYRGRFGRGYRDRDRDRDRDRPPPRWSRDEDEDDDRYRDRRDR